ncbi:hypothetical protein M8J77_024304 [Diaphorina citri]|nr:hypothetical protein M8J77_024304 [Diaphorina citri]
MHVNIRSIRLNWDLMCIKLRDVLPKLDLLVLTEIGVKEEEALTYQLRDFEQINKCRTVRNGGGLMILYKQHLQVEDLKYSFDEAENIILKISHVHCKITIILVAIYRPPKCNVESFLDDLNFWLQNGCKKDEKIVMLGDINICTLKKTSNNTKYLNILYNNALIPYITKPTREEMLDGRPTITCIDHINIRLHGNNLTGTSSVIKDKLADHYFTSVRITKTNSASIQGQIPSQTELIEITDNRMVQRKIQEVDWDKMKEIDDPKVLYATLLSQFDSIYKEAIKKIPKNKKQQNTPWVNEKIKREIKQKNILLKRWQNNKHNVLMYEEYKKQRNVTTNTIKKEKRIYLYKLFKEAQGDMLRTWKIINEIMDRKIREPNEIKLKRHFQTNDIQSLANEFNKNFINQVLELKNKNQGPTLDVSFDDHTLHNTTSTMYLRNANEKDIREILKSMNKRGKGSDGIRNKDIIENSPLFTPCITYLINLMIKHSTIPDQLKTTCITPLYKKGKPDVLDDAPEIEVTPDEMSEEASSIGAVEVTLGGAVTLQCPNGAAGCWSRVGAGGRLEAVGPGPKLSLNRVLYQEGGEYRCLVGRSSKLDRLRSHNVQVSVVAEGGWTELDAAEGGGTELEAAEGGRTELDAAEGGGTELDAAEGGGTELDAAEGGGTELDAAERGWTELDAAEGGRTELDAAEGGGTELDAAEGGGTELDAAEGGRTELDAAEGGGTELDAAEGGRTELDAAEGGGTELDAAEGGGTELDAAEGSRTELEAAEGGGTELDAAEGGRTELDAAEGGGTELDAAEGGGTELDAAEGGRTELDAAEGGGTELDAAEGGRTKLDAAEGGGTELDAAEGGRTELDAAEGGGTELDAAEGGGTELDALEDDGVDLDAAEEGGMGFIAAAF